MVEIVRGTGIERILSRQEVREDKVVSDTEQKRKDAQQARVERLEITQARQAELFQDSRTPGPGGTEELSDDLVSPGATDARARLARVVTDPQLVNDIIAETQSVDAEIDAATRLQQASLVLDSFRRSFYISLIDPGRSVTFLSPRDHGVREGEE